MGNTISRYRGDTHPIYLEIEDEGEALDISGYSFKLTVNSERNPTDTSNQLFSVDGTVVNGPGGLAKFVLSTDQADNVGRFYFDIQQTDTGGADRTIVRGDYISKQDITK